MELLFGAWAADLVAVPINAKLHPREVVAILEDSNAATAFASPRLARDLASALAASAAAACAIVAIGSDEYAACLSSAAARPAALDADTLAWLFYTSGTTGRSKGAMLSHRNLLAMTVGYLADVDTVDEHASLVHAAPMSHGSGLYVLPYVARAARHVVPASAGYDPHEFLALCERHPACAAFLAPTMVQRLRAHAERSGQRPRALTLTTDLPPAVSPNYRFAPEPNQHSPLINFWPRQTSVNGGRIVVTRCQPLSCVLMIAPSYLPRLAVVSLPMYLCQCVSASGRPKDASNMSSPTRHC